jgi:hypothetical protein
MPPVRVLNEVCNCVTVTPRFRGQTWARIKFVIGSSLTHTITHGTETNVTSLLYNKSSLQNSYIITSYEDDDLTTIVDSETTT